MKLTGLKACTEELVSAATFKNPFPPGDDRIKELIANGQFLKEARATHSDLPKGYPDDLLYPFVEVMEQPREKPAQEILALERKPERHARLFLDIAQAILQRNQGSKEDKEASFAADEVIADLYDGFFDEVAQEKVRAPTRQPPAPLVAWTEGPVHRTWSADQTAVFGPRVPIVAIPAGGIRGGLLGWAVLAHEIVGHDVLSTFDGLADEFKRKVWTGMEEAGLDDFWCEYWASRVDEAASDVMGILSMGPAFGIALIGYLRALNEIGGGEPKLSRKGEEGSPYPADFLRVFLILKTIDLLKNNEKGVWVKALQDAVGPDLDGVDPFRVGTRDVKWSEALKSASVMARTLTLTPLDSLKDSLDQSRPLIEFQDWSYTDQRIVDDLRGKKGGDVSLGQVRAAGPFAAHVVAAAVMDAVEADFEAEADDKAKAEKYRQACNTAFSQMKAWLIKMHEDRLKRR